MTKLKQKIINKSKQTKIETKHWEQKVMSQSLSALSAWCRTNRHRKQLLKSRLPLLPASPESDLESKHDINKTKNRNILACFSQTHRTEHKGKQIVILHARYIHCHIQRCWQEMDQMPCHNCLHFRSTALNQRPGGFHANGMDAMETLQLLYDVTEGREN